VDVVDEVVAAKLLDTVGVRDVVGVPGVVEDVELGGAVVMLVDVADGREVPGADVVEDDGNVAGAVLAGTVDADVPGSVDGKAPGGDCGPVVLVVLEVPALTGLPVLLGTPGPPGPPELSGTVVDGRVVLVVEDVAVLGLSGTVVVVVVVVLPPGVVVVVLVELVVDDAVAGTVVVVVTGKKLVVVVVELVVVVVAGDGRVWGAVSADASGAGASAIAMPTAKTRLTPRHAAVSRAIHLLEL
jgi:hypothetical protein